MNQSKIIEFEDLKEAIDKLPYCCYYSEPIKIPVIRKVPITWPPETMDISCRSVVAFPVCFVDPSTKEEKWRWKIKAEFVA